MREREGEREREGGGGGGSRRLKTRDIHLREMANKLNSNKYKINNKTRKAEQKG